MKYKLTLLKDLPDFKAGTEVLNISQEEMNETVPYSYTDHEQYSYDIFILRNNPEWVKVEEDLRCDCLTKNSIELRYEVIGYGRCFSAHLNFNKKNISIWYDHHCDSGTITKFPIKHCPLCGREL